MSNWDTQFEQSPQDDDSPSDGPQEFTQTKTYFRERFENAHEFDLATPDLEDQGWHKEGSAKSYYQESTPVFRPDGETSLTAEDNGRLWIRPSTGEQRVYEHPSWTTVTLRSPEGGSVLLEGEYNIDGVKNFDDSINLPEAPPQRAIKNRSIWGNQYNLIRQARNDIYMAAWENFAEVEGNFWATIWIPELSTFVTLQQLGTPFVRLSPDGLNWNESYSPFPGDWRGVAWSPARAQVVAVSWSNNYVMFSSDARTWELPTTTATMPLRAVTWSPELGIFVAVGSNGAVFTATNPDVWTQRSAATNNDWRGVAWSPELGLFAAVSYSGSGDRVMTSPDGINWTSRTTPADIRWTGIVWAASLGMFAAVAGEPSIDDLIMTSYDGITWTRRATTVGQLRALAWSPEWEFFVAASISASANGVLTSKDGVTWTVQSTGGMGVASVAWSGDLGIFVGIGPATGVITAYR